MTREQGAHNQQAADRTSDTRHAPTAGRRFPPLGLLVVIGTCVLLAILVQFNLGAADRAEHPVARRLLMLLADHANRNVASVVLMAVAAVTLCVWFVVRSGYRASVRLSFAGVLLVVLISAVAALRIDGFSGDLVPIFALRWAPRHDELLKKVAPENVATVDLKTTTPFDFPQFLGPNRDLHTSAVRLERNWDQHPPKQIWQQPIGAGWSAFAAVNGYAVTLEQRGEYELVTCYEVTTGQLCWSHEIQARHTSKLGGVGPRGTPTIHEGKVYALGGTGILRCLDGSTGELVWQLDLLERYQISAAEEEQQIPWGRAASPLIYGDLCVVPAGGPPGGPYISLLALHKDTGQVIWEGGDEQISYSSPVATTLAGVPQILIVNESSVTGHNPENGKVLWRHPWPGSSNTNATASQAVPVGTSRVLLSKGYNGGAALLELQPGEEAWEVSVVWEDRRVLNTKLTNVVLAGDYIYGLSNGILECVHLETGERQWKRGRYGHGQILGVHQEVLLVISEQGEVILVEISPEEHRELGRFRALGDQTWTWNNLCLYGPYLLVRNAEQAACWKLATQ